MKKLRSKVYYSEAIIDPLINGIFIGSTRKRINICSKPIVILKKKNISLGFCNTSNVDDSDKYAPTLQEFPKKQFMPYMTDNQDLMSARASYGHMSTRNLGLGNPTTCVYQFLLMNKMKVLL